MLPLRRFCRAFSFLYCFMQFTSWSAAASQRGTSNRRRDSSSYASVLEVTNVNHDLQFGVNITIGCREFAVQLDTGSSDLWINAPNVSLAIHNDSGLAANQMYGSGSISGMIQFAEMRIGEYTIPSQAFIRVNETEGVLGSLGVLGLAYDGQVSVIERTIQSTWGANSTLGRTVLANIFTQNASIEPYYDVLLGRSNDLEENPEGSFTIGAHAPGSEDIVDAPILPVAEGLPGRWAIALEGMSVNGMNYTLDASLSNNTRPGTIAAEMDTGSTASVLPKGMVDFIYGYIPGSLQIGDKWMVPCASGANLTFIFGGQEFPVHPLDLTAPYVIPFTPPGTDAIAFNYTICIGRYYTMPAREAEVAGDLDIIFGDSFMKNVYASFHFASETTAQSGGQNYIQMLATSNQEDAWVDFLLSRSLSLANSPPALDPIVVQYLNSDDDTCSSEQPSVSSEPSSTSASPMPSNSFVSATLSGPWKSPPSGGLAAFTPRPSTSVSGPEVAGALADHTSPPTNAVSTNADAVVSVLSKYGPSIIGLLAANIVAMLLLTSVALVACLRRGGPKSRAVSASYAPVSFRDKVDEDAGSTVPVRNYGE